MAINLVCYTELSDIEAEDLNTKVSQDALFRNNDFLIYKVSKYTDSLEVMYAEKTVDRNLVN